MHSAEVIDGSQHAAGHTQRLMASLLQANCTYGFAVPLFVLASSEFQSTFIPGHANNQQLHAQWPTAQYRLGKSKHGQS